MSADYFANYWLPCILMGAGIALDVLLATIAQFNDERLNFRNWTLPVTITHIIFPATGYYLFYLGSGSGSIALSMLGLIGAFVLGLYLYELICEWIDKRPFFAIASSTLNYVERLLKINAEDVMDKNNRQELLSNRERVILILAVSWDALFSGPAKSAQADAGQWTQSEVIYSFIIAGLVVAVVAQIAMALKSKLAKDTSGKGRASLIARTVLGRYLEVTIIGAFGMMSLWNAGHWFWGHPSLWICLIFSGYSFGVLFYLFKDEIRSSVECDFGFSGSAT